VLPVLRWANPGDIGIHHQWTGDPLRLHSFWHRSYWYKGFRREFDTMTSFLRLVGVRDTVLDIGGHIGYTALFFAFAAPAGKVHVFEPGPNNLPYIRTNVAGRDSITLVEKAVGARPGTERLLVDGMSGQNNSLRSSRYANAQRDNAFVSSKPYYVEIDVTTVDDYCSEHGLRPDFVKVDVEGFELDVLEGASQTLETRPVMMVEVTDRRDAVVDLLSARGYEMFDSRLRRLHAIPSSAGLGFQVFFLDPEQHEEKLRLFAS